MNRIGSNHSCNIMQLNRHVFPKRILSLQLEDRKVNETYVVILWEARGSFVPCLCLSNCFSDVARNFSHEKKDGQPLDDTSALELTWVESLIPRNSEFYLIPSTRLATRQHTKRRLGFTQRSLVFVCRAVFVLARARFPSKNCVYNMEELLSIPW